MVDTWIKLYRKFKEHEIIKDSHAVQVYLYLLLEADSITSKTTTGRFIIARDLALKPSTVYATLKRLEKKYKVITQLSNNRFTEITLLNWDKYQANGKAITQCYNNKITTKQQQDNTIQEYKNIDIEREIERKTPLNKTPEYLVNIPLEDIPSLKKETSSTDNDVVRKGEALYNWLLSKGKTTQYKDFKALLRNAITRDFPPIHVSSEFMNRDEMKRKGLLW